MLTLIQHLPVTCILFFLNKIYDEHDNHFFVQQNYAKHFGGELKKKGMSGHPTNLGSNKRQDRRQVHREQSHFSDLIP